MTYQELEEKLLKEYKMLYMEWIPADILKMKRVENKPAKNLLKLLISKAYEGGLKRANEIVRGIE